MPSHFYIYAYNKATYWLKHSDLGDDNLLKSCNANLMEINIDDTIAKYLRPEGEVAPILVNSPHSGRFYPPEFIKQSRLPLLKLRSSEDAYIDAFLSQCAGLGIPALCAVFPRSYVDLNRAPTEIDVKMLKDHISEAIDVVPTARSRQGLGVIPSIVSQGQYIYAKRLGQAEVIRRLTHVYNPYHAVLTELIKYVHQAWNSVLLIDLHSMPSQAGPMKRHENFDIVLGDRFGASCSTDIASETQHFFKMQGLHVGLNHPYAGGFITQHYARPEWGFHTMQIEINRALYMNEATLKLHYGFDEMKQLMFDYFAYMNDLFKVELSYQNAAQ